MRQFHSSTSHELVEETPALAESSPHDGDGVGLQVIGSAFRHWVVRTGGAASKGRTTWLDSNGDRVVAFVASRGGVLFSGEFGLFGLVEVRTSGVVHGGVLQPGWLNEGEAAGAGCSALVFLLGNSSGSCHGFELRRERDSGGCVVSEFRWVGERGVVAVPDGFFRSRRRGFEAW
ncbi:hypothetical protein Droror1_Dr00002004 [Drosera rotundifolia]